MRVSSPDSNSELINRARSRRKLGCDSYSNQHNPIKNNSNIQRLNIDGFFFESSAVANMLQKNVLYGNEDTKNTSNSQFQSREIIFRNISIDSTVLKGAIDLLNSNENNATTNHLKAKTDIDIIHCSGMVSELIGIVLPHARRFGFAGNIPIAHNLDTEGLAVIGETLGNQSDNPECAVKLQSLVLKGTRLDSAGFSQFCYGLRNNTTLEELQMSNCILEEEDVRLLASTLRNNKTLKSIFFADCKFGTKPRLQSNSRNGRYLSSTQSINNAYPQINLPTVLTALVGHPTLESLKIYDMVCNDAAIQAIGQIVGAQGSKLKTLGLKNNLSHPRGKLPGVNQHLLPAVSRNHVLTYLKLSGNNLNDENMNELSRIVTQPTTSIQTLCLSDNLISNGLLSLAANLQDAKSLQWLDLLRNPIKKQSRRAMVTALKNNVQLERLDIDGSWSDEKFWWLSLNRGGRRALQSKGLSSSLWPKILERAYNIPMRRNPKQPPSTTNAGVAYYLIRRIPGLFEKKSSAPKTTAATSATTFESRTDSKRQRETIDSMEGCEPRAKRIFNP